MKQVFGSIKISIQTSQFKTFLVEHKIFMKKICQKNPQKLLPNINEIKSKERKFQIPI